MRSRVLFQTHMLTCLSFCSVTWIVDAAMAGAALSALPLFVVFLVANLIVEGVRLSGLKG